MLPHELWVEVARADVVIHAGDWIDLATFDVFDQHARRLVAVYGNNDVPQLRQRLPEVVRVELDGLRLAVIHDSGPAKGREQRCERLFPDVDVLVLGIATFLGIPPLLMVCVCSILVRRRTDAASPLART